MDLVASHFYVARVFQNSLVGKKFKNHLRDDIVELVVATRSDGGSSVPGCTHDALALDRPRVGPAAGAEALLIAPVMRELLFVKPERTKSNEY